MYIIILFTYLRYFITGLVRVCFVNGPAAAATAAAATAAAAAATAATATSAAQCCSCFFYSGRTVVYRNHYKRPQFSLKVYFGGRNYRLQASHVASHVDWPSRTLYRRHYKPAASHDNYSTAATTAVAGTAAHLHSLRTLPPPPGLMMAPPLLGGDKQGCTSKQPFYFIL